MPQVKVKAPEPIAEPTTQAKQVLTTGTRRIDSILKGLLDDSDEDSDSDDFLEKYRAKKMQTTTSITAAKPQVTPVKPAAIFADDREESKDIVAGLFDMTKMPKVKQVTRA